jgi:NADPH2:quinone reductase
MRDGIFGNERPTRYALRDATQAHEDIAARRLTGAAILVP